MVNTIEITIIVIIIQIIYKYINRFIFKNKPVVYELLTDKIKNRLEELEKYIGGIDKHYEEISSTSSRRIDSMLNDIDRIRKPDSFTPVSTGNDNRVLSTNTDGVVGTIEFPRGMIISWIPPQYINTDNDEENRIRPTAPVGWAYCDGTNGTPDLRCRYLVGMGYEDEKMMINMKEEYYDKMIQAHRDYYKEFIKKDPNNGYTNSSNWEQRNPFKNLPDIVHNNIANNKCNYMVGFTYNNGQFRNEYNRTFYKCISNNERAKKIKNELIAHHQLHLFDPSMLHPKLIYKPEKETYIFNFAVADESNPDVINYAENSPIYDQFREKTCVVNTPELQTAVYYLMKL